jgi:hypothetical protein
MTLVSQTACEKEYGAAQIYVEEKTRFLRNVFSYLHGVTRQTPFNLIKVQTLSMS